MPPNLPSASGQFGAIWREMLKDVRDTFNKVFFGQKDGAYEIGTPLAPTQSMVNKDLGTVHGPALGQENIQKGNVMEPNQEQAVEQKEETRDPMEEARQRGQEILQQREQERSNEMSRGR